MIAGFFVSGSREMLVLRFFKKLSKLVGYKSSNLFLAIFTFTLFGQLNIAKAVELRIVTENSYPVQYLENNTIKGKNADTVNVMLKQANVESKIEFMPWARAYNIAQSVPNVMIFSIARTPAREHEFIWGRPITDLSYSLYTLKENVEAFQKLPVEQLKQLSIATIRNSATEQYLAENQFSNIQAVNNPVQMISMLNKGRIDAIPANNTSIAAFCQKMSLQCDLLTQFYPLPVPSTQLYFAFSKGTDPKLINRLLQAYDNSPDIEKLN